MRKRLKVYCDRMPSRWLGFFLFLFLSCAKKALPPSPDRFPPRLLEINSPNRTEVVLTFDEEIKEGRFLIFSPKETVGIRAIKIKNKKLTIYTKPLHKETYRLVGEVSDLLNNFRHLNVRFLGSTEKETIKPEIKGISLIKDDLLEITFSEPMETTNFQFFSFPIGRESISLFWSEGMEKAGLKFKSHLPYISFLFPPTLTDLEGNRLKKGMVFQRFFDTLRTTKKQEGKVFLGEKGVEGVIIFVSNDYSLFALTDKEGNFQFNLPVGSYKVFAFYDQDFDNLIDFSSFSDLEVPSEPVFLRLEPEKEPKPLSDYLSR
uniref:SbsA Ig-like domain-containing protein n=1 Tax=candidate division WOR-3 bacterium TaxID=2052148 RepID=A0A7C3UPL3_UNCW3